MGRNSQSEKQIRQEIPEIHAMIVIPKSVLILQL